MSGVHGITKNRAAKVALTTFVAFLAFVTVSANFYVRFHYAATMPRSPEPQTGRIYAIPAQYGGTVYVNRKEYDTRNFVEEQLLSLFGVTMILYFGVGAKLGWWKLGPKPTGGPTL